MKIERKIAILTLIIVTVIPVCFTQLITINVNRLDDQNDLDTKNSSQTDLLKTIWDSVERYQSEKFELSVELSGYRIISTNTLPIEYEENGHLYLAKNKKSLIDIKISLKDRICIFEDIQVRGHVELDIENNYFFSYNLDDYEKGFFMDLLFLPNSIQIDLAFDGGDSQLCYEGIHDQGYSEITPLFPHSFEPDQLNTNIRATEIIFEDNQVFNQLTIDNQKYFEENNYETLGISFTKYGISHEAYDFGVSYPDELPDDYWEPYSTIQIGIYRLHPSEAQIKSDLQYYNKDRIELGQGYSRNVLAYSMGTHGGPYWEVWQWVRVWWWWVYSCVGYIYPSEIEALWYHSTQGNVEIDVKPWDTIAMSDTCFGYYKPPSTNPTMAKAFVDYGATAFVGATISTPADSDDYMRAFWYDLCQGNYNVNHATTTLCNTYGNGWNLGDEWRIYGDQYGTLP